MLVGFSVMCRLATVSDFHLRGALHLQHALRRPRRAYSVGPYKQIEYFEHNLSPACLKNPEPAFSVGLTSWYNLPKPEPQILSFHPGNTLGHPTHPHDDG